MAKKKEDEVPSALQELKKALGFGTGRVGRSQNVSETEQLKGQERPEAERKPFGNAEYNDEVNRKRMEAIRRMQDEDQKKYGKTRRNKEYGD